MLCAGIVHGDLSEYNVLVDAQGPVVIDLPQAIDAAGNNNAASCWNETSTTSPDTSAASPPSCLTTDYGKEMWQLYESGALEPENPADRAFSTRRAARGRG